MLNSQEIYNEPMIIMLVGIFVQTLLCKLMIYLYEFDGVIASVNMSSFFMLCLLVVVIIMILFITQEKKPSKSGKSEGA